MPAVSISDANTWTVIAADAANVLLIQAAGNPDTPAAKIEVHAATAAPADTDTGVLMAPGETMEPEHVAVYLGRGGAVYARADEVPQTMYVRLTSELP